jgi:hypothetical protein
VGLLTTASVLTVARHCDGSVNIPLSGPPRVQLKLRPTSDSPRDPGGLTILEGTNWRERATAWRSGYSRPGDAPIIDSHTQGDGNEHPLNRHSFATSRSTTSCGPVDNGISPDGGATQQETRGTEWRSGDKSPRRQKGSSDLLECGAPSTNREVVHSAASSACGYDIGPDYRVTVRRSGPNIALTEGVTEKAAGKPGQLSRASGANRMEEVVAAH